ncbi:MAG: HEPN domain-containing protein [Candidatus Bathyarchaeia archaeon]
MSIEEVEVMRRRAEAFLANAQRPLEGGEWDLAIFSLGQIASLYCLKALPYTYEEKEVRSLYRFVVERFKPLMDGVL